MQLAVRSGKQKVLIGCFLLLALGSAVLLFGRWWSRRGESWNWVGNLPKGFTVRCVAASDAGVGVIGGYIETLPAEAPLKRRMLGRTALVWRLEEKRLEKVYEGSGWIQSIHHTGSNWSAVAATLKSVGVGSDYRLITSSDRARRWEEVGQIPARSITQIVSASSSVVYVFGADTLTERLNYEKEVLAVSLRRGRAGRTFPRSAARARLQCRSKPTLVLSFAGPVLAVGREHMGDGALA